MKRVRISYGAQYMLASSISYSDLQKAYSKVRGGRKKLADKSFRNFKTSRDNSLGLFFVDENHYKKSVLLKSILDDYINKKYNIEKYHCVVLPKKGNGIRTILVPSPKDRILFSAINQNMAKYILPEINKYYIFGSGKRKDLSNAKAIISEVQKCSSQYSHVLKIDIKKFFPSISKRILLRKLKPLLNENTHKIVRDSFYNRIEYIFSNKLSEDLKKLAIESAPKGIPQGCAYSPLLANYYALSLDALVKSLEFPAFRYLDDMIIFTNSEKEAQFVFKQLKKESKKLKVEFHDIGVDRSKTYIQKTSEVFEYLGIDILPDGTYKIPLSKLDKEIELIKKNIVSFETIKSFGAKRVVSVLTEHIKGWRSYYKKNFPSAYEDFLKNKKHYNNQLDIHYKTRTGFRNELKKLGFDIHKTQRLYDNYFFL